MAANAETPSRLAGAVVPFLKQTQGIDLDYSVESLQEVDAYIERLRITDTSDSAGSLLTALGCYVGQVLVRHAGGEWHLPVGNEMVIRLRDGSVCTPIRKALKRFQNGPVDSLAFFYRAVTEREAS